MSVDASPPVVVLDGLSEAYRRKTPLGWRRRAGHAQWALQSISFEVAPGEMLGVIGPNGAGKSTLLLCIAGVLPPSAGRVAVEGRIASLIDLTAGIHREFTGRENIRVSSVLNGLTRAEARLREREIADFSGLDDDTLDSPLRTYSAGMGLRLGFSVVVHSDPQVLLVDEVLAVGDEEFQAKCLERVQVMRGAGTAVILVSHDLDLVAGRCDRVAYIDRGHLVCLGDPRAAVATYLDEHGQGAGHPLLSTTSLYTTSARQLRRRERRWG